MKFLISIFNAVVKWTTTTLLIFIALNVVSFFVSPLLPVKNKAIANSLANDPGSISKDLYADKSKDYLVDVLTDLFSYLQIGLSYFPHAEYCETPFRSKTLNILTDPTGMTYRSGYQACFVQPDSSKIRVYVFGGSTSMGLFVGDKESWPSQLQKALNTKQENIEVVNYAVMGHGVTEEYLRFYDLVKLGHRPSLVLVMDGLNLGMKSDQSKFSNVFFNRIKELQQGESAKSTILKMVLQMPLTKLLIQLAPVKIATYFFLAKSNQNAEDSPLEFYSDKNVVLYQTNRFNTGISDFKSLCKRHHIELLYFLQPNAFFNYPVDSCSACSEMPNHNYKNDVGKIYAGVKTAHSDVIDLTGLFAKYHQRAIVDDTHYSIGFNAYLANEVGGYIKPDSLRIAWIDSTAATGAGFAFFSTKKDSQ